MSGRRLLGFAVPVLAIALVGCGGSTGSPSADAGGASIAPSAAASVAPAASPSAQPSAAPSVPASAGAGTGATACALVTAAEAGQILGMSGVTTVETPGEISFCIYNDSAGAGIAASSLMVRGGSAAFGIWKSGAGVRQVDGLGDDAVFDPSSATLLVLSGDAIYSVTAGLGDEPEDQRLEWERGFAMTALGRL